MTENGGSSGSPPTGKRRQFAAMMQHARRRCQRPQPPPSPPSAAGAAVAAATGPPLCQYLEATWVLSLLIVVVGLAVAAAILALQIPAERLDLWNRFHKTASEADLKFQSALEEYQVSSLWVQQACHRPNMTFEEFEDVYRYIVSTGLEFEGVSCGINVTAARRPAYERQARAYLAARHPSFDYLGFSGYSLNRTTGTPQFGPRANASSYFVSHFVQPLDNFHNLEAIDFDMFTSQYHSKIVVQALRTGSLAVTERLALLPPPTDPAQPYQYCLTMAHPGLPGEAYAGEPFHNAAILVIRFAALMEKAYHDFHVDDATTVYIYDATPSVIRMDGQPAFFGGARLERGHFEFTQELNYTDLVRARVNQRTDTTLSLAARQWTIVTVAYPGAYEPNHFLAIFGALMIVVASFCAALWIYTRSRSRAEKAAILLEGAKRAAQAERELNDFIAHEVRNPLSAAISATAFVSSAVHERQPLVTAESRESIQDDVKIIGNSLQYINDLLRSMLDMHCTLNQEISIRKKHVDIYHDILTPVAAMMYRRGCNFDVIVDCPEDLVVMSDPLRLKQVVLNLALNATKFVIKGFVRLRAQIVDGNVYVYVEDSGPGIPLEKQEHLFSKFQSSLDVLNQGTGIGLSLCKNLVERLRGEIYLDKAYSSGIDGCPGSCFVIQLELPPTRWETPDGPSYPFLDLETGEVSLVVDQTEITYSTASADDSSSCESMPECLSVLFVDDDFILRKLFARSIKKCLPQWEVCEAASGEAALQLVQDRGASNQFDIIFLDQYMASTQKQLLGTETARLLRSRGFINVICGLSANDIGTQFMEAGANCFIIKPLPCDTKELKRELNRVLNTRDIDL